MLNESGCKKPLLLSKMEKGDKIKVRGTSVTGTVDSSRVEREVAHGTTSGVLVVTVDLDGENRKMDYVVNELKLI